MKATTKPFKLFIVLGSAWFDSMIVAFYILTHISITIA